MYSAFIFIIFQIVDKKLIKLVFKRKTFIINWLWNDNYNNNSYNDHSHNDNSYKENSCYNSCYYN